MRNGSPPEKEPKIKRYYLDVIIPVGVFFGIVIFVVWLLGYLS